MASSVLVSLIVILSFYGCQVDGKIDRYTFNIVENGTSLTEQVEVDVEKQTEVIRVPQHNDADAVEVLNDFIAGLSARRLPASKDCYVSKLDSSVPSPAKMKLDMDQASRQSLPDKVITERTGWRVVGFADRLALPEKILDFCGSLPIYNVEELPLDSMNVTLHRVSGQGRRKRSHWRSYYYPCSAGEDIAKMNYCLRKVGHLNVKLSCKYRTNYCTYRVTCIHQPQKAGGNLAPSYLPGYSCSNIYHMNFVNVCCSPIC